MTEICSGVRHHWKESSDPLAPYYECEVCLEWKVFHHWYLRVHDPENHSDRLLGTTYIVENADYCDRDFVLQEQKRFKRIYPQVVFGGHYALLGGGGSLIRDLIIPENEKPGRLQILRGAKEVGSTDPLEARVGHGLARNFPDLSDSREEFKAILNAIWKAGGQPWSGNLDLMWVRDTRPRQENRYQYMERVCCDLLEIPFEPEGQILTLVKSLKYWKDKAPPSRAKMVEASRPS